MLMFILCAQDNAPVGTAEGEPEALQDVVQKKQKRILCQPEIKVRDPCQ